MKSRLWIKQLSSILALVVVLSLSVLAQGGSKSFRAPANGGELEVINKMGPVSVNVGDKDTILIRAKQANAPVTATQSVQGKVKVEVMGKETVELEITVPPNTGLDVNCIKGEISIRNMSGTIKARTTEGDITVAGVRSSKVDIGSVDGSVSFSGDILPTGNYILKSFSGRVSAVLPAAADFKLNASSNQGGIDVGGVGMSFDRRTNTRVEGTRGTGSATVTMWTQQGTIQIRQR